MKVICETNNIYMLSGESIQDRLEKYINLPEGEMDLTLKKIYVVYGVVFRDNSPWYYICSGDSESYPKPFPAECFDIVDDRLSSYWKLSVRYLEKGEVESSLVIEEWFEEPYFYELLLDDDPHVLEIFKKYRKLIDIEY